MRRAARLIALPLVSPPALSPALALVLSLTLAACTQFPELDAVVDDAARAAPYPDLVPLETVLGDAPAPRAQEGDREALEARAAALRRRAAGLGGPVLSAGDRDRLGDSIPR